MDFISGIADEINHSINITPNPATEYLFITCADGLELGTISIIDTQGRVMLPIITSNDHVINITALNAGLYLLKIETDKFSTIKKFIKN